MRGEGYRKDREGEREGRGLGSEKGRGERGREREDNRKIYEIETKRKEERRGKEKRGAKKRDRYR